MPTISVVMPAYNAAKTISDAIRSVLEQTYTNFELIIVNDCSTDQTESIILDFAKKDSRIIYLKNPSNSGVAYTRNYAIACAQGEWIAFLDSDDLWKPEKLERQMALLTQHPDGIICYTASAFINEEGDNYSYVMQAERVTTYNKLLKRNLISCSSVIIKSTVMRSIKMPNDRMHEDYYVWLTVLKTGAIAYGLNEPLLIYRLSTNSKSGNRLKSAKMLYHSYRAVGFVPFVAFLYTFRYMFYSVRKRRLIKGK